MVVRLLGIFVWPCRSWILNNPQRLKNHIADSRALYNLAYGMPASVLVFSVANAIFSVSSGLPIAQLNLRHCCVELCYDVLVSVIIIAALLGL